MRVRVEKCWAVSGVSSERVFAGVAELAICTPHTPLTPRSPRAAALTSNDDESTARGRKAVCVMGHRGLRTTMRRAGEHPMMLQECGLGNWGGHITQLLAWAAFICGPGRLEAVWSPSGPAAQALFRWSRPRGSFGQNQRQNQHQHNISIIRPSHFRWVPRLRGLSFRPPANVVAHCLKLSPLIHGPVDANDQTMIPRFRPVLASH